jgi:hypothetical protein
MKRKIGALFFSILAFSLIQMTLHAAPKDPVLQIAKRARAKKGKVIMVTYKGGNGTFTPQEAVAKATPGCILQFSAGNYRDKRYAGISQIEIDKENIIIEGDKAGRLVNINIVLLKSGCIVRNLRCNRLEAGDVTVVDSRLTPIIYSSKGRTASYMINSIIHHPIFYANNTNIYIRNCTVIGMYSPPRMTKAQWRAGGGGNSYKTGHWGGVLTFGKFAKKGELFIKNCVLYTNGYFFNSWHGETKPLKIELDGNVIYCGQGTITDKDGKKSELDLKELKSVCRLKEKGKNYIEKTKFTIDPPMRFSHWGGRAYWVYNYYKGIGMVPKPGTRADKKKWGADIGSNGMPEAPAASK